MKSMVRGTATLISFDGSSDRALIAEIEINCPGCGTHTLRLAGHHLRTVQRLVAEWIEQFPEETGNESGIEQISRMNFAGNPPGDPRMN